MGVSENGTYCPLPKRAYTVNGKSHDSPSRLEVFLKFSDLMV